MKVWCLLVVLLGCYWPFLKHELCVLNNYDGVLGVASNNSDDFSVVERNTHGVHLDTTRNRYICTNQQPCTSSLRTHHTIHTHTNNTLPQSLPCYLYDPRYALSDHKEMDRQTHNLTEGVAESKPGYALRFSCSTTQPHSKRVQSNHIKSGRFFQSRTPTGTTSGAEPNDTTRAGTNTCTQYKLVKHTQNTYAYEFFLS